MLFRSFFLICDRLFFIRFSEKIGKVPSMLITYLIVLVGWVFFRSENISYAISFSKAMFSFNFSQIPFLMNDKFWFFTALGLLFAFAGGVKIIEIFQNKIYEGKISTPGQIAFAFLCIALLTICAGSITSSGFNPFIYFRF